MSGVGQAHRYDPPGHASGVSSGWSGHSQVAEIQRARILSGVFDVVREQGAGGVSVAHVVERAGVSRRTFYEFFEGREDCLLAAFKEAVLHASERVIPAFQGSGGWRERVRSALIALLGFLEDEPAIGHFLVVESLAAGPRVLESRRRVLARIVAAVEEGRDQRSTGAALPPLTGEGVVGGVLSVIHARMVEGDGGELIGLANPLMSMIVMPYLGSAAARRELERPVTVPASRGQSLALLSDPFKDAGMRLTYRTVRVLVAIAEHPQASNRLVGESAGIADQGQISKLLARLERIGLLSNTGLGPGKGAPNAWSLTPRGYQVTNSIHTHTEGFMTQGESGR